MGRKITKEELDEFRQEYSGPLFYFDEARFFMCRGEGKGCQLPPGFGPCDGCYSFFSDDKRTNDQIIHDMNRGDA